MNISLPVKSFSFHTVLFYEDFTWNLLKWSVDYDMTKLHFEFHQFHLFYQLISFYQFNDICTWTYILNEHIVKQQEPTSEEITRDSVKIYSKYTNNFSKYIYIYTVRFVSSLRRWWLWRPKTFASFFFWKKQIVYGSWLVTRCQ